MGLSMTWSMVGSCGVSRRAKQREKVRQLVKISMAMVHARVALPSFHHLLLLLWLCFFLLALFFCNDLKGFLLKEQKTLGAHVC